MFGFFKTNVQIVALNTVYRWIPACAGMTVRVFLFAVV